MKSFLGKLLRALATYLFCSASIQPVPAQTSQLPASNTDSVLDSTIAIKLLGADERDLSVSPDGKWLAYLVFRHGQGNYVSDIYVTEVATKRTFNLTGGLGDNRQPAWSPHGDLLAFYSDRTGEPSIWLWSRSSGQLKKLDTGRAAKFVRYARTVWLADGETLLVRLTPTSSAGTVTSVTAATTERSSSSRKGVEVFVSPQSEARSESLARSDNADLVLVNVRSNRHLTVARDEAALWVGLAPDGSALAYSRFKGLGKLSFQRRFDIVVFDLATQRSEVVSENIPMRRGLNISWSPDSSRISYVPNATQIDLTRPRPGSEICIVSIKDHSKVCSPPMVQFNSIFQSPLWSNDGSKVYLPGGETVWQADVRTGELTATTRFPGKKVVSLLGDSLGNRAWKRPPDESLIVMAQDPVNLRTGFYAINEPTNKTVVLMEEEKQFGGFGGFFFEESTAVLGETGLVLYSAESVNEPEDFWLATPDFSKREKLTTLNPEVETAMFSSQRRVISWKGRTGSEEKGLLLLPANYRPGTRYPLIVKVYAESLAWANSFGLSNVGPQSEIGLQQFAARGYAVLFPSVVHSQHQMKHVADVVLPGVEEVVRIGVADRERIGVIGYSFGSYRVMSLLVQSTVFKAAAVGGCLSNLFSYHSAPLLPNGSVHGMSVTEGQMGMGTPWDNREKYIENSPWLFLDRVTTPIFVFNGVDDTATSVIHADQIFAGLSRLGKPATYVRYAGEKHGFWKRANMIDLSRRLASWFDNLLKVKKV